MIRPLELLMCAQKQEFLYDLNKISSRLDFLGILTNIKIQENSLVLFELFNLLDEDYLLKEGGEE